MIIVRLTGGLGNQMFQYAFGRELAEKHGTELKLDISSYSDPAHANPPRTYDLDIFNIQQVFATDEEISKLASRVPNQLIDRILNRAFGVRKSHIREPHFHFSKTAYESPNDVYLSGYWQSEKYFQDVARLLRREFTFRDAPSPACEALLNQTTTGSVCVHVRRGDFVINPTNGLYGVDYYKRAEELICERVAEPSYFVFSDDLEWCRANLKFNAATTFVDHDFGPQKFRDDLRLMATCKHYIIPNSSFSWWAVWLNTSPNKTVIAPKAWFRDPSLDTRDLIPDNWVTI